MSQPDPVAQAYLNAHDELSSICNSPGSSDAAVAAANKAIDALNAARTAQIWTSYASRTAGLNALVERLNGVTSGVTVDVAAELNARLGTVITAARNQILALSAEAFVGAGAAAPNADAVVADPVALDQAPAPRAAKADDAQAPATPAPPARPHLDVPAILISSHASDVPDGLGDDYEKLFAACIVSADRVGQVNFHLQKLAAGRERYAAVGGPLGIPWWFIGIVHGLETGFRFDRHLHNGDPLTAATVNVPKGRPPGDPPFAWEVSAVDALKLEKLDQWNDWSPAGALYKWEQYNGFGYRKHHAEVLTPYLWSFTNHYTKGKYVADGSFVASAVSKQCGAAAMLRALVNKGEVSIA